MKLTSKPRMRLLPLLAAMLIVSACGSPSINPPSVLDLPKPPKPQAPSLLMEVEKPRPLTSLQRLKKVFETSPKTPTGK